MDDRAPEMLKSTLLAGCLAGLVAGLPGLDLVNTCTCCSFVVVGGFLASYLYSRECRIANHAFQPGSGATVGLVAGAFFAISNTIVQALSLVVIGPVVQQWFSGRLLEIAEGASDFPAEALDKLREVHETADQISLTPWRLVMGLLFSVLFGAVFSTIGGLIGGAVFRFEPKPLAPVADADSGEGSSGG